TARAVPVLVFARAGADAARCRELEECGVEVVLGDTEPLAVLEELGRRKLQSVLIEGGSNVAGRFLEASLVNKATFFVAPIIIGA
ncbi:dihydrofolate reductase family protein, partial [Acinetobacter baumannii]